MTGQVAFVTKEEIAGEQPVDEGLGDSGEFTLAESEQLEALSPAGETVRGRWELQEIGRSGEQIPARPLVGVNGGLERKDQFWDPLHFVDREQSVGELANETVGICGRCRSGHVIVERDQSSAPAPGDLGRQGGLANLARALNDNDPRVGQCLFNPWPQVSGDMGRHIHHDGIPAARRFARVVSPIREAYFADPQDMCRRIAEFSQSRRNRASGLESSAGALAPATSHVANNTACP